MPSTCAAQWSLNATCSSTRDPRDELIMVQNNTIAILSAQLERLGSLLPAVHGVALPTLCGVVAAGAPSDLAKSLRDLDEKFAALSSSMHTLIAESSRDILGDVRELIDSNNSNVQALVRSSAEKMVDGTGALTQRLREDLNHHVDLLNSRIDELDARG